jgi:hypothetical protein
MIDELQRAATDADRCTLLTALGNAGAPDAIAAVRPFFNRESPSVRACASQAVRRIPGDEADALLRVAVDDPAEEARLKTVDAMLERTPSAVLASGLAKLVVAEPSTRVRGYAIQVAGKWVKVRPELAAPLAIVAEKDAVEDFRRLAQRALAKK